MRGWSQARSSSHVETGPQQAATSNAFVDFKYSIRYVLIYSFIQKGTKVFLLFLYLVYLEEMNKGAVTLHNCNC